jgi:hypothetical protein
MGEEPAKSLSVFLSKEPFARMYAFGSYYPSFVIVKIELTWPLEQI